jgi:hypothetical protein
MGNGRGITTEGLRAAGFDETATNQSPAERSFFVQQFIFTFAKALEKCLAINRLDLAAFQIVIAAVEHFACLRKLGHIPGQCIFEQLVGRTSSFDDQLVNLGLQLGGEMYFHGSQRTGKSARWQRHWRKPSAALFLLRLDGSESEASVKSADRNGVENDVKALAVVIRPGGTQFDPAGGVAFTFDGIGAVGG